MPGSARRTTVRRAGVLMFRGLALVAGLGCQVTGQGTAGVREQHGPPLVATPDLPLAADGSADISGGPFRIVEVPGATASPRILRTPLGWLALSWRSLGDPKLASEVQSVLYRSADGVNWQKVRFDLPVENPRLGSIAYGAGRYVIVGDNRGQPVVWSTEDLEHWVETPQGTDYVTTWRSVQFAGDRFFAMGGTVLGSSADGEHWSRITLSNVQPQGVAYGNGVYVLAGSGPLEISDDGMNFRDVALDCALPSACVRDPSGGLHQINTAPAFVEGRFYVGQLMSTDGLVWQPNRDGPPRVLVNGWYFRVDMARLQVWRGTEGWEELVMIRPAKVAQTSAGRDERLVGVLPSPEPLPESVGVAFEDGLDCRSASCVLLRGRLYLAPPPGTPPLPDHVARTAEGSPLLSDACPVSTMITCDDYAQRRGCQCRADAPRAPHSCQDVSNFQCAGRFELRPGEWELPELGDAGCTCDFVDPNQPATLGTHCAQDASVCAPPMRCLPVDAPASFGPPSPRPQVCTAECVSDRDCPSWQASGFCAGPVSLRCSAGSCQPRDCH